MSHNSDLISDVLATRYATKEMKEIWSQTGRIVLERELWIAVLKAQKELGIEIEDGSIKAYEKVLHNVNLESINDREKINHHDVKSRIDEFCDLAGFEQIHKGMTSRDLTENVEQLQIISALKLIRKKAIASLKIMSERAIEWKDLVITARTHNVAAQPTTLGKRLAMFGQEILCALGPLNYIIENFAVKGIKGAVGTSLDLITLFNGDSDKILQFEEKIAEHLGISQSLNAVGQVYPRSLDFQAASAIFSLSSGASSFAKTLRIMAGNETASEGFSKGQVGSSAMPHKMNSRSCERINGFAIILNGYLNMLAGLSGDQWNEGDVSCSVVRRVALPGTFYAADGLFETFITVLEQMSSFPAVIANENEHYFPFLCSTTILMEAVKKGAGRETAHEAIKEHAVATVLDLRDGKITQNNLLNRLANDSRLLLTIEELQAIISKGEVLTGNASNQVKEFSLEVQKWLDKVPEAANYSVSAIL